MTRMGIGCSLWTMNNCDHVDIVAAPPTIQTSLFAVLLIPTEGGS